MKISAFDTVDVKCRVPPLSNLLLSVWCSHRRSWAICVVVAGQRSQLHPALKGPSPPPADREPLSRRKKPAGIDNFRLSTERHGSSRLKNHRGSGPIHLIAMTTIIANNAEEPDIIA